jgi:ABC-type uncharacterized transport system permease subunit
MTPAKWVAAAAAVGALLAATSAIERRPNRHHEIVVSILKSFHDRLF